MIETLLGHYLAASNLGALLVGFWWVWRSNG